MENNIKPLGDRVLIEELRAEEKTASGIILPDSAQEKPQQAKVLAKGTSKKIEVKPGDKVIVSQYSGDEIKIKGRALRIIKNEDILAIIK